MNIKTFSIGGIHPEENKLTHDAVTQVAALPKQAIFPLSQHIGAPAKPVVQKGDRVKVGTMIAEAGGFVSAPIFSSVSGTVAKIDTAIDATGYRKPAIYITVNGDEWEPKIDRSDKLETVESHPELTPEEIVNRIKNAGVVGMGGACFPTFIKLTPPPTAKAECVIINAVECEPYITADFRLMMEKADEILIGLELLMMGAKVTTGYIGIETNKMPAIELLTKKCAEKFNGSKYHVEVVPLKQRYPQGGEKQLVDAVIQRQVPAPPAIPVNVGAIVQNVGTAYAVYEAVMKHKPLFERYTTVTGKKIKNPGNFLVTSVEVPICKGTNSVTVISDDEARRKEPQPCIRCAKCVGACPMGLEPYLLAKISEVQNWERAEQEDIVSCIECGSCQFTCPAHRPLLDNIRQGKSTVMGIIRSRAAKK